MRRTDPRHIAGAFALVGLASLFSPGPSQAQGLCSGPIGYRIGHVDERFGLSQAQVEAAVGDAEAVWESALRRDLFHFDPDGLLEIALVYDDRQRTQDYLTRNDKEREAIQLEYDRMTQRLETERSRYDRANRSLNQRMRVHNRKVDYWNQRGGAPPTEYRQIQTTSGHLRRERDELVRQLNEVNRLVQQLSRLADHLRRATTSYNRSVTSLHQRYSPTHVIGELNTNRLRVFSFGSGQHLRLVLAHELGHALGLGHVEDPDAIMYFKSPGTVGAFQVTPSDRAEFDRVCGNRG